MNDIEKLAAQVKLLQDKLQAVEDSQQIERLQRIYGYYLDNKRYSDLIDLFSENAESIEIGNIGVYLGKKGVVRLFDKVYSSMPRLPGGMALHLQIQGVVTVDPEGNTAKGRWHCLMIQSAPVNGEMTALWGHGKYENEYVKENGKWLFSKVNFNPTFRTSYADGWVKVPAAGTERFQKLPEGCQPDMPPTAFHPYPEDFLLPYHFSNPITGK